MAREDTSAEKFVNPHPLRIDVAKFNGTNNFGMWRCEVMNALNAQNLEDTLFLPEKSTETLENDRGVN